MNQPGIAAVLSFFIPGVGQIYNGDFLRAVFWFIVEGLVLVTFGWMTFGLANLVVHLLAAYTAYHRGKKYVQRQLS